MIRAATPDDIPALLEMGRKFAEEAGVAAQLGWSDDHATALLGLLQADHILLIGDRAFIGGTIFPHPFSGELVFQELFWRSEGRDGLKLLAEAERLAKERGATRFLMIAIDTMPGAERIYQRRGYRPAERSFIKEL